MTGPIRRRSGATAKADLLKVKEMPNILVTTDFSLAWSAFCAGACAGYGYVPVALAQCAPPTSFDFAPLASAVAAAIKAADDRAKDNVFGPARSVTVTFDGRLRISFRSSNDLMLELHMTTEGAYILDMCRLVADETSGATIYEDVPDNHERRLRIHELVVASETWCPEGFVARNYLLTQIVPGYGPHNLPHEALCKGSEDMPIPPVASG